MAKKVSPFPTSGSICPNCRDKWENQEKSVRILVGLPSRTLKYHHEVAVCPYCDGDEILSYSKPRRAA